MPDDRVIRSEVIPGTVNDFRALMKRLGTLHKHLWTSSDGKELLFSEIGSKDNPRTESWSVMLFLEAGAADAGIEAYESLDRMYMRLDFLDGYSQMSPAVDFEPIGAPFEEFAEMVIREIQQMASIQEMSAESGTSDEDSESDLLPKTEKKRNEWKEIWPIIREVREQFKKEWDNLNTDNPKPKLEDYRDAIALQTGWKPSGKTVYRIIKAGEAGLLD